MKGDIAPLGFRFSNALPVRRIGLDCVVEAQPRLAMRTRSPDETSRWQTLFMSFIFPEYLA
jgi:hypothetical protein